MRLGSPHPLARGVSTLLAISGALLAQDPIPLALVWLGVFIPLSLLTGIFYKHFRFILIIVLPIIGVLLFVWGWLVGAPPGEPLGTSPGGGIRFSLFIGLRLAFLGGVIQMCLLTIPSNELVPTLKSWGVGTEGVVMMVGTFSLIPELRLRADQVLTARYARGFLRNANIVSRIRNLPYVLRPLFAWALRSAHQRSECWIQRGLIDRLADVQIESTNWSSLASIWFLVSSGAWFVYNILAATHGKLWDIL